jgi:A1 cistron-splicing factor AAR2
VIVLLDAPPKIQLGVDNTAWIVGNKFKGVKLIPLGVHFVYYALADEKYQFKLGFFCDLQPHQRIVVRRWHSNFEDFLPVDQET